VNHGLGVTQFAAFILLKHSLGQRDVAKQTNKMTLHNPSKKLRVEKTLNNYDYYLR